MNITVNMQEAKRLLNFTIDNNERLQTVENKTPIAISLEAEPGIGKTSLVRQVAEERGMGFVKLNLSQVEEQGD